MIKLTGSAKNFKKIPGKQLLPGCIFNKKSLVDYLPFDRNTVISFLI